jgi:lysophospholipase L1-like esterase
VADIVVGHLAETPQRHLLRLAPGSRLHHKSREFDYDFVANRLGLRGADVPFQKPPGTFRIVIIGDSFVAGYGVADENLFTRRLEQQLQALPVSNGKAENPQGAVPARPGRIEVVNLGRVGTSTVRELDLYETLGRKFQPDLVILAYYLGNDLAEVVQEQTHAELAQWHPSGISRRLAYFLFPNLYLELAIVRQSRRQLRDFTPRTEAEIVADLDSEARARGREPGAALANYHALAPELRSDVMAGLLSEQRIIDSCIEPDRLVRALDPDDASFDSAWQRTRQHLDLLQQAVRRDGARLAVTAIPAPFQLDRKSFEFHKSLGYEVREDWLHSIPRTARALDDWAQEAQVPWLDLTGPFRESGETLYFVEDVHWNPAGNARAAEAVADFLTTRKLLP